MLALNNLYLMDCMDGMKHFPDKFFDIAVVDPPYGTNFVQKAAKEANTQYGVAAAKKTNYTYKEWDLRPPDKSYFTELFRVSKNQIIWGANHFISLIPYDSPCWLIWDKDNGSTSFADCELAWSSFKSPARKFTYTWNGFIQGNMKEKETRIHPTQKPAALYKWIYSNYCKEGDKILDTHAGSASSFVAAYALSFDYIGFELDTEYHAAAMERVKNETSQIRLSEF